MVKRADLDLWNVNRAIVLLNSYTGSYLAVSFGVWEPVNRQLMPVRQIVIQR